MKTYAEAVADVTAARIPPNNIGVSLGEPDDYGVRSYSWLDKDVSHAVRVAALTQWEDKADDMLNRPENYPRRWVTCETSAGLAEDERGEIADYSKEAEALAARGWEYIGSGGYRIEVEPESVPEDRRPC